MAQTEVRGDRLMLRCHEKGCTAKVTHRLRIIAGDSGEIVEVDYCTHHAEAMNEYITQNVPGATYSCGGRIRVDSDGPQISEGWVH